MKRLKCANNCNDSTLKGNVIISLFYLMNWETDVIPIILHRYVTGDASYIESWLSDYYMHLQRIKMICSCNHRFGYFLTSKVEKLYNTVWQHCFDFLNETGKVSFKNIHDNIVNDIDIFFIDIIVGTFIKFLEDFNESLERWSNVQKIDNTKMVHQPMSGKKKKRPNIPKEALEILKGWFQAHVGHPYPKIKEKERLSQLTCLSIKKIENWFINERSRKWQFYINKV